MNGRRGFTLVETSVVVAVIGLLSAIAIPSFSSARAKSLNAAKQANVRKLNSAVEMWAMDTGQATIDASITNYLRSGIAELQVGDWSVNLTNIVEKSVDHIFTIVELY